jgi:hypothetical protein
MEWFIWELCRFSVELPVSVPFAIIAPGEEGILYARITSDSDFRIH